MIYMLTKFGVISIRNAEMNVNAALQAILHVSVKVDPSKLIDLAMMTKERNAVTNIGVPYQTILDCV